MRGWNRATVFPRIKIHSIDYPEKVTLATIRNLGVCLCPRCLAKKRLASKLGTLHDTYVQVSKRRVESTKRINIIQEARRLIYDLGHSVQSKQIKALLQAESYVPTLNAFSRRLSPRIFKFNIFETFVVDQLHEIELGVWKSLFQHLIRLLHLGGSRTIVEFNKRFRSVSTFGSTIRMFSDDVASMGRLAARDFEDILQTTVYLCTMARLTKLCRHTTETLKIMKKLTTKLGSKLRNFAEVTQNMNVRETPDSIHVGRNGKQQPRLHVPHSLLPQKVNQKPRSLRRQQMANVYASSTSTLTRSTRIGNYVNTIAEFGTTDLYSTQICELQHCFIKNQFERTNKKDVVETDDPNWRSTLPLDPEGLQSLLDGSPYTIGQTERSADLIPSITRWIYEQRHDDAMKFFIPQLKRFFLARFLGNRNDPKFNEEEILGIRFHQDRMYRHKTLRINYTSYDVSYGNVVPRREDFVHVRWLYYNTDEARQGGWDECRLDHIGYEQCYTDQDLLDSFDFVHPSDIIRAVHLIPNFQSGSSGTLLNFAKSIAHNSEEHWDWKYYYVNRFVDRDMLMRYLGEGLAITEREGIEVSVETGEEGKNANMESKGKGSNGEESICLALDKVSDEEEPSVDKGPSEFKDDVSEDEMEGHAVDEDEDDLYGF
ncbi:hypothetical protein RHS01_02138 [Rhizoctonia solani]|uniref:Uncharacterized protein n=1 Tax=Rhizoctonia solani TaxID=456999 RepID=A0A8H7M572_9AGAM|nr:hypothetical protein RHS01_02138 [Rhizoctonia solani]